MVCGHGGGPEEEWSSAYLSRLETSKHKCLTRSAPTTPTDWSSPVQQAGHEQWILADTTLASLPPPHYIYHAIQKVLLHQSTSKDE